MKKVITYGTFDLFHYGHYNILKRAKALGDYLIVGVTGESFDIERGKLGVRDSLPQRIENVRKTGFADEIIIEEFQGQKVQDIQKYGVDILVVGSDWRGKFDYLKSYCDVVYLERTKNISSTQIRQHEQNICVGLMLDSMSDNEFVLESKYVSGIHVDRVFSEDLDIAKMACQINELDKSFGELEAFFDGINAVYVHEKQPNKGSHIRAALLSGKHVLSPFPITSSEQEFKELIEIAQKQNVIFLPFVKMAYMQAINQMFWMVESGVIGKVIALHCSLTNDRRTGFSMEQMEVCALYAYYRLFRGKPYERSRLHRNIADNGEYLNLFFSMDDASALLEIGREMLLPNMLTVYGERGKIVVPDDFWETGYFEIVSYHDQEKKRYSYNYEGTGVRYILQEMLIMLREHRMNPLRFTYEDCIDLQKLYQKTLGGSNE